MKKTIKTGFEIDQFKELAPIKGKDLKANQLFTNSTKKLVYVAFEGFVALRYYDSSKSIVINPNQTYYLINKLF